jgi:hypothetical protein
MEAKCKAIKQSQRWCDILVLAMSLSLITAHAAKDSGLFSLNPSWNPNKSRTLTAMDTHIAGWLNAGLSINPDQPKDSFNGPIGFSDRANELQLNQLYLYLERLVDESADNWNWGGRLDFIFGSDAFYTRSIGHVSDHWDSHLLHERIYGIAFPQAYLDVVAPIGNGLHLKLGEFYTFAGYEAVIAPDNFFYSRSYTMQFGEPFSHTGILTSYSLHDQFELSAGAVTGSPFAGWDGSFEHHLENWGFIGGFNFRSPATNSKLSASGTHGTISEVAQRDVNLYSVVAKQDFNTRWHLILEHDYGWITAESGKTSAEWYGVVGSLTFDINPQWSSGLRLEWFRDDDGVRVGVPARTPLNNIHAANYYAATIGGNWRPMSWITIRPNIRYDNSDGWQAFNNHSSNNQLLISTDVVLSF